MASAGHDTLIPLLHPVQLIASARKSITAPMIVVMVGREVDSLVEPKERRQKKKKKNNNRIHVSGSNLVFFPP